MQLKLDTDSAIRVLLSLSGAGCKAAVKPVNGKKGLSFRGINDIISELIVDNSMGSCPNNPDRHDLILTPDKVTLQCAIHEADDVAQVVFTDTHPELSLSNLVLSALDKRLVLSL